MKGPAESGQICSVGRRKIAKKIAKNKSCYANTLRPPLKDAVEGERTTPRATFRGGQLSLQSNEIFGRTNPIPKRSRRRANCAQAFVAGPAVFPLYFQRAALAEVPRVESSSTDDSRLRLPDSCGAANESSR
jgi:hypothetical protein